MPRLGRSFPIRPEVVRPYGGVEPHIVGDDIEWHYSGGASGGLDTSLGGAIGPRIYSDVLDNLWDDANQSQCVVGVTNYACIYIKNNTSSGLSWTTVVYWINQQPKQGSLAIGLDSAAVGLQAVSSSATPTTAPSPAVAFSSPTTKAVALSIGDIPPGSYKALWVQRSIPPGASAGSDSPSIHCEGNTA